MLYTHFTLKVPAGDRVTFIGNSAHSISPQLGQDAHMVLLEAAALAWAIESVADISSALAAYLQMPRWHVRLYQSDSSICPVLRDISADSLAKIPPLLWPLVKLIAGQFLLPRSPLSGKASS